MATILVTSVFYVAFSIKPKKAQAAITLKQTKGGDSGGYSNSFNFTFTSNVTAGSLLILNLTAGNADVVYSVIDTSSNTWSLATSSANSTVGERKTWLYYAKNVAGGSTTVTVTYNVGMYPDTAWLAREYSGIDTTSPLDKTSAANDGTSYNNSHSAGTTAATTQADELVVLFGGSSAGADPVFTAGSGYGNGLEQKGYDAYTYAFLSDKIVATTGTQTGTFSSSDYVRGQAGIVTFKATVAAAPATNAIFYAGD